MSNVQRLLQLDQPGDLFLLGHFRVEQHEFKIFFLNRAFCALCFQRGAQTANFTFGFVEALGCRFQIPVIGGNLHARRPFGVANAIDLGGQTITFGAQPVKLGLDRLQTGDGGDILL